MAEVLVEFDTVILAKDGKGWIPRACGRVASDGLWEGWIEFVPADGLVAPIRTARETEQPNRADLMYWATGLTGAYLEEALKRALEPRFEPIARPVVTSHFDGPATGVPVPAPVRPMPRAVLNPFEVYLQGQDILVQELGALDAGRLRDIAIAYGFGDAASVDGARREELTALILAGVRRPLAAERPDRGAESRPESNP